MKIVIVGPGAIGCLFAAYLSKITSIDKQSSHEVWLFAKDKERADKLTASGIKIETGKNSWSANVHVTAEPDKIQSADLIIICVKSYHTKDALNCVKSLIKDGTLVLTLQNGIGNIEIINEIAGPEKVLGGITNHGATLITDGHIRHAGEGETVIGRIDGKIPAELRQIREIFNKVGIEMHISRDIKSLLWSKLIVNVGINALTAITRLTNGKLLEFEGTRNIMRDAVREAVKVAKKKKIKLIYDDPLAKVESVAEATSANVSSMLQDILKKKHTEVDFINGVIVRQGQSLSVPTPVNCVLLDLVKTLEASYEKTTS